MAGQRSSTSVTAYKTSVASSEGGVKGLVGNRDELWWDERLMDHGIKIDLLVRSSKRMSTRFSSFGNLSTRLDEGQENNLS